MPENTPIPTVPEVPIVKPVKTTNSPLTVILLLLVLVLLGTTAFFAYQNMQLSKQVSEMKITTSPSSTVDPTANWKTYSSNGFSFKYPSNLTDLKGQGGVSVPLDVGTQNVVNFGDNTTISQGTDAPYDGFSIYVTGKDARQSFTDYVNKKVEEQKNSPRGILSDKVTNLNINGHLVEYIEYANNIREYFIQPTDPTAVVVLIRINKTSTFLSVFDQILSTFQFTNSTTKDLNAIKNACINLEGTPVAWNDSLQECIDVKGTLVEIKSFCQQYGGNFVDNASAVCSFLSDISTWKTFPDSKTISVDTTNSFSFKYPNDLSHTNSGVGIGVDNFVDSTGNTKFNVIGFKIYSQADYNSYVQTQKDNGGWKNLQTFVDSQGRSWETDIELAEVYNLTAVYKTQNKIYVVGFQSGPGELTNPSNDGSNFRNFIDQILSTFQFTQ